MIIDDLQGTTEEARYNPGLLPDEEGYVSERDKFSTLSREALERLAAALEEIADTDYRGNRSSESVRAHAALVAEGMRQ